MGRSHATRNAHLICLIPVMLICWPFLTAMTHTLIFIKEMLSHSLGLAYTRHLDAPREVQVQFASRTLQEWDPTFIANVARDGIILFKRGPLPIPFAA